jgi:hypothetical protein
MMIHVLFCGIVQYSIGTSTGIGYFNVILQYFTVTEGSVLYPLEGYSAVLSTKKVSKGRERDGFTRMLSISTSCTENKSGSTYGGHAFCGGSQVPHWRRQGTVPHGGATTSVRSNPADLRCKTTTPVSNSNHC